MKERFKDGEVYGPYILPEVKVIPSKQDKARLISRKVNQGINKIGKDYVIPSMLNLPIPGEGVLAELVGKGLVKAINSNIGRQAINLITTGDRFTNLNGKFGYYGNPIERLYGTISRRLNLPDKPRNPELIRKLDKFPTSYGNTIELTSKNNSNKITNFTTDRPVVSHTSPNNNWDHMDTYIFDSEIAKNRTPISIEPSDTFYAGQQITSTPKQTTIVSGDIERLKEATEKGLGTLSSKTARKLYNQINKEYLKILDDYGFEDDPRFKQDMIKVGVNPDLKLKYANEIQRLQSTRGTPTIQDYMKLQKDTGLKAGIRSVQAKEKFINNPPIEDEFSVIELIEGLNNATPNNKPAIYPNGRRINGLEQFKEELKYISKSPYNKVFYDPTSMVEYLWKVKNGIKE